MRQIVRREIYYLGGQTRADKGNGRKCEIERSGHGLKADSDTRISVLCTAYFVGVDVT